MTLTSRSIRRQEVAVAKRQPKNYARLRDLVDQWIDLGIELSILRIEDEQERREE